MGQRAWEAARWRAMLSGVSHRGLAAGSALLAGQLPANAASRGPIEALGLSGSFDPQGAMQAAVVVGLSIFALVTALLHQRERARWALREKALASELASLRGAHDRAELLMASDRQLLVTWAGRDSEPRLEGDPTVAGEGASFRRVLAFGSWLAPADAGAIEGALERLRDRGEAFRLTARTLAQGFVDLQGRAVNGSALLRIRDVTGDHAEMLRKSRELDLARSDLQGLRALLDGLDHPIWLRDADGRLSWANRAYLAAVEGRTLDEVQARALELLDRAAREESARRRAGGDAFAARLPAVVAGQRRVLDVAETSCSSGSAGLAIDVSELEAVRADLQRQMQAHGRTLDQLPTAVAIFDAKQRLVFHNAAYKQLWGLDAAFLEARPTDGEVLDRLRAARKLPEQADFRTWKADILSAYRSVDPQESWWHLPDRRTLRVVTTPNPQGGVTYLFDDLSERVRLEAQYNSLIRSQGETLDTLTEGVAAFGTDGRLKLWNRAFLDLWRVPPDLAAGHPHIDALIRHARALAPEEEPWVELRGAVAGLPDRRLGLTCRLERRDGSILEAAAQPLPDGATLLTFIDVTASVNVERALTERNDALERAAKLRDDFVHHVSYELRSPLTNIIGFAQLLGDETVGALNPKQKEYAGHIMRSSGALLAIINDILDLASIDTGLIELQREVVDVRQTIQAAVRGVEDRLAEASLLLQIDVDTEVDAFSGDAKRVRQVLFNLLSNAIGFSSAGQTIRVRARRAGAEVALEVTDQGKGMPPEVQARVFERFETHTLGTRHRGVGLGLSIVRSFVELHGGRVELSSAPGQGTTVTCYFPADGAPAQLAAAE